MNVLTFILGIVDPLLVAFMASMIIGITMKRVAAVITLKYVVTILAFLLYMLLYIAAVVFFVPIWKYIVMFAPFALIVIVLIISIIVAPKDKIKEQSKQDLKMTGWGSMFPNDIDNNK